jgi:phage tail sheath protein FI
MATLVSAGVSVSVINQSFFFPAVSTTVPLFFVATKSGKVQLDGVTPALGTLEAGVVRTVTSLAQSLELYGVPSFRTDISGNAHHGDARNEYGLMALNQYLGAGNRAYVVRADIDLDDEQPETFYTFGTPVLVGTPSFSGLGNGTISGITATNNKVKPQTFTVSFTSATAFTVRGSISGFIGSGTVGTPFTSSRINLTVADGSVDFQSGDSFTFGVAYAATAGANAGNGTMTGIAADTLAVAENWTITFTSATSFNVVGSVSGTLAGGTTGVVYDNNRIIFTITPGSTPFTSGDTFTLTTTQVTVSDVLGSTDAARRTAIVTALAAAMNSNTEVRSDLYEFTLVAAPGYHELSDELAALVADVKEEAFAVVDTPCNLSPAQTAAWAMTSGKSASNNLAYYYPWCVVSNLDGKDVLAAPSGTAIRTIAFSDQNGYVWTPPAGVANGLVTGVSKVGYVTGTLGTATTFVEAALNEGQRDALYEYNKNINPITFFPGRGILIWGQKTAAPAASALDRINVARLVAYVRRVIRKGAMPFVFQPNDQITRDNLKAAVDGILSDVLSKRGLYDFATLCDESNNTPDRIDRNELVVSVAINPTRAAEFIYIPVTITGSSGV